MFTYILFFAAFVIVATSSAKDVKFYIKHHSEVAEGFYTGDMVRCGAKMFFGLFLVMYLICV